MTLASALLWLAALLLVGAGIAGTVLPGLPGALLVGGGLVLAAWADGFTRVGAGIVVVLVALAGVAHAIDFVATAMGAQRFGASRRAVLGATVGAIVGLFFGVIGIVFGPFIGAVIGELSVGGDVTRAGQAGAGAWLGLVLGTAAKIALVFTMIGIFALAYFV
jgi:uncharacterized protein YqgC (DUF456 family)